MTRLHDLLILRITQQDREKTSPLAQIVGRAGIKWDTEVPVDKGWIDIYVPRQERIRQPYVIEVETGYDLNCSGILQKFERFRKALTKAPSVGTFGERFLFGTEGVFPKLCVVIPPDFAEFIPLFKAKEISVFLWEGEVEWKCKKCEKSTFGRTFRRPPKCMNTSCNGKEKDLQLVDLKNFKIGVAYRVP